MYQTNQPDSGKGISLFSPKFTRMTMSVLIAGMCSPLFAVDNGEAGVSGRAKAAPSITISVQSPTIVASGVVTDNTGFPLPGVTIIEKGNPSNGTVTDVTGKFTLTVSANAILEVTYVGFQKVEIQAGSGLNITMKEQDTQLGDVVVVGYGTQQKVNLTGSVATLDSKALSSRPIQNVSSGIQGLMPGVTVMSGEGRPGQDGSTIRCAVLVPLMLPAPISLSTE